MSPRKAENNERINVFFSPRVLQLIKLHANARGMSVSGYVRFAVIEYLHSKGDISLGVWTDEKNKITDKPYKDIR